MPPKKKSKAPGKSVPHGEEFDAPFVGPAESSSSAVDANAENIIAIVNRVSSLEKIASGPFFEINQRADSLEVDIVGLMEKYGELEGDLIRIVDLIVKGDIDSVKFKEILSKRQGSKK